MGVGVDLAAQAGAPRIRWGGGRLGIGVNAATDPHTPAPAPRGWEATPRLFCLFSTLLSHPPCPAQAFSWRAQPTPKKFWEQNQGPPQLHEGCVAWQGPGSVSASWVGFRALLGSFIDFALCPQHPVWRVPRPWAGEQNLRSS